MTRFTILGMTNPPLEGIQTVTVSPGGRCMLIYIKTTSEMGQSRSVAYATNAGAGVAQQARSFLQQLNTDSKQLGQRPSSFEQLVVLGKCVRPKLE